MAAMDADEWAAEVAAGLGKDWSARATVDSDRQKMRDLAYVDGPAGQRLHVRVGGHRNEGRITISWSIDGELTEHSVAGEQTRKSIGVSDQKPPATAAKDIVRRLLPGLPEMIELLGERKLASDEQNTRRDAFLAEVSELVGGWVSDQGRSAPEVSFGSRYSFGGTIKANCSGTAALEMWLPSALVLRVAKVIGDARRGDR